MMFERLGKFIVKRHKAIIVFWLILLAIAVPFAPLAEKAVVYDETAGSSKLDLDSIRAEEWVSDNFGGTADTGSMIIVVSGENVTSSEARAIVNEIELRLIQESPRHGGTLNNNVTVQTIYSTMTKYTAGFLIEVNDVYYTTYDELNQTRSLLYDIPLGYQASYNWTKEMQSVLFGLPSLYVGTWDALNASMYGNATWVIDSAAYATSFTQVQAMIGQMGLSSQDASIALNYYSSFTSAWNSTANDSTMQDSSALRYQVALPSGFANFSQGPIFQLLTASDRTFITNIFNGFSIDDYLDTTVRNAFVQGMFVEQLGHSLTNVSEEQRSMTEVYFSIFYSSWNDTGEPDEVQFRSIVESSVNTLSHQLPSDQGELLIGLFSAQTWDQRNDPVPLARFTSSVIAANTKVDQWLVMETAGLGCDASSLSILMLAEDVVKNQTLADYPLPIIPALISGFINAPRNDTMLVVISFEDENGNLISSISDVATVRGIISSVMAEHPDYILYLTGSDAISKDIENSFSEDIGRIDPITIVLVLVLIGLFFRSFVASAVPPAVIGFGLGISFAIIYFLGTYLLSINYTVLTLMITSMLGAGCDYCIFILSRYREERRKGQDKNKAVETSVTWAGEAIATSGLTVIIGFGALSLGSLDVMRSMGLLAIGITCALLLALTLLPSFLVLLGDRMFWPSRMERYHKGRGAKYFTRSAHFAIKHSKAILLAAVLISIPTTYLVFTIDTSYDYISAMPSSESKEGLMVMSEGFGGGKITPTTVGVQLSSPVYNSTGGWDIANMNEIENITAELASLDNVKKVFGPTRPYGELIDYRNISANTTIEGRLYNEYMRTMVGENDTAILITVIFVQEPFSQRSIHSIMSIRDVASAEIASDPSLASVYVGGGTAVMYDVSELTQKDFQGIIAIVIIGIYIVLLLVLGSVINPLRSILTILLSISWTLAVTLLIFEHVFGQSIMWLVPLIMLVVCLGLGMDYDILLTTRVREEAHRGRSTDDAIVYSVEQTGGIITACGIIMGGAFGTMMLSQSWLLREFGFALMFAILLDATIVRIYLVPSIMSLLGKWNWWAPGRLQRTKLDRMEDQETTGPKK